MGDERDQDVQRTPLWPADPEPQSAAPHPPGEPAQPMTPDQPTQWGAAPPDAFPGAYNPQQSPQSQQPWQATDAPWGAPPPAPNLSDAPTMRVSAAPASPPAAPDAPPAAAPTFAPAHRLEAASAPAQHYSAAPPVNQAPAAPAAAAPVRMPDAPTTVAAPPPAPPVTPPATPQRPQRKGLSLGWRLGLTLLVIVLLVAGAGGLYAYASSLAAAPNKLMASYCAALTHDDYRTAYSLLSASAQGQEDVTQYLSDATARDTIEGPVTQCAATPTQNLSPLSFLRSPRSLIFNAQITRRQAASGQIALTRDALGWHVAALSSTLQGVDLGPLYTEQALCNDLSQRAYEKAYALLSTPYQKEQGNAATFARAFGSTLTVSGCAPDLKSYSVNSADQQATVNATLKVGIEGTSVGSASSTFTVPAKLAFVREATGWRVDAITPLLNQ
jgi:hypothetical protein